MRVRVRFRVNSKTGEVELFLVEDISTGVEPDHDAVHDRIAYEVGKMVERRPAPEQVVPGTGADAAPLTYIPTDELPGEHDQQAAAE